MRYPGLKDYVQSELMQERKTRHIFEEAKRRYNYQGSLKNFQTYCSRVRSELFDSGYLDEGEIGDIFIDVLKKKEVWGPTELCEALSCPPNILYELIDEYRMKGYEIIEMNDKIIYSKKSARPKDNLDIQPLDSQEIIFGIVSDPHFGSTACQISAIIEFTNICKNRGVKHIFVPGDLVAGYNVYTGQIFDLYAHTADEQEASVIRNLPFGFDWYVLGGNHDYSFISKGGGHNPILTLSHQRDDIHYIGFDQATVPILPGVDAILWHPSGGVPYAISYRMQKGLEQIAFNELYKVARGLKDKTSIRFLFTGHLHVQIQCILGGIFAAQTGCFEGQTNYLRRKSLFPTVGGWIIEATLDKKKRCLKNFDAKFELFDPVDNDFENYNHDVIPSLIDEPIFNLS